MSKVAVFILLEAPGHSQLKPIMFVISRGCMSRENNILPTCKFSLLNLNACAQSSLQICALDWAGLIRSTCCESVALGTAPWVMGAGGRSWKIVKDTLNKKQCCVSHLHMCTWRGPHRVLPEILLLMRFTGQHKHQLLLMKISLEQFACFIPLQLQSSYSAFWGTAASFIWVFPAWLGE